jgi:hypothetical protein
MSPSDGRKDCPGHGLWSCPMCRWSYGRARDVALGGDAALATPPTVKADLTVAAPRVEPLRCRQCGGVAEEARRCYATPVCYACLPPPKPLPIAPLRSTPAAPAVAAPAHFDTCPAAPGECDQCLREFRQRREATEARLVAEGRLPAAPPLPLDALHAEGEVPPYGSPDNVAMLIKALSECDYQHAAASVTALQAALTEARAQLQGARDADAINRRLWQEERDALAAQVEKAVADRDHWMSWLTNAATDAMNQRDALAARLDSATKALERWLPVAERVRECLGGHATECTCDGCKAYDSVVAAEADTRAALASARDGKGG